MPYLSPSLEEQMDQQEPLASQQGKPPLDTGVLAVQLRAEYDEAERARSMVSLRWLEDLRQYRGMYAPEVIARLKKTKRAQVYYRMTTAKINTMTARLMDLLFPQRTKNWAIEPTPDPVLPDDVIMQDMQDEIGAAAELIMAQTMQELQAQNVIPDMWDAQNLMAEAWQQAFAQADTTSARVRIAKDRASAMERVIDDQLRECNANGQRRPSWQQNCRAVVKSACLYGMGVLKGPLVERVETKRFTPAKDENGNTTWREQVFSTDLRPYHESVSVWDIFPDPGARLPAELRFVWQLHMMTDKDLLELSNFPGFNGASIRRYINEHPDGDAQLSTWESQVRDLNEDNASGRAVALKNRYRVYERWGFLAGRDLAAAGADISEDKYGEVYSSNVWMLGDVIVKAMVNPLEGIDISYFFYPYQQDDTSFWPEGIACALRAPQAGINASVRAMQDNAGASSGPIYGINMAYLAPGEDPLEMQANRIFLFNRQGVNLSQAFHAVTMPRDAMLVDVLGLYLDGRRLDRADYVPSPYDIVLRFTPQADAVATIEATARPARTATAMPAEIMEAWGDVITHGALARLKSMSGTRMEWTDAQGAALHNDLYNEGCADARTRMFRNRHGGGTLYVNSGD